MPNSNEGSGSGRPQEGTMMYRGGFSTSIYDGLFEEHGRSDCCVLTCCGILLYDRNLYLLADKRPSWRARCGIATCFCIVVLVFLGAMVAAAYLYLYEMEHIKELQEEGRKPNQDDVDRVHTVENLTSLASICRILIWAMAIYLLFKAAQYRYRARRFLMGKLYEQRTTSNNDGTEEGMALANVTAETPLVPPSTTEELNNYLRSEQCNICCATAPLGCIPEDAVVDPTNSEVALTESNNGGKSTDLCHCLWKTLSCMCCGGCCSCWIQCLGLCAIAQEDHELQRMLPKIKFQVDYITFQPFSEYFPKLEALRQNQVNNLLTHFSELSQLSHHLCQALIIALTFVTVLAFTRYDPLFQPAHLLVLYLTLLQAFVIIFLVHWMWNRFDLSFDAVVKYFASGFILCTTNAFVYETFVSTSLSLGMGIIRIILNPPDDNDGDGGADDAAAAAGDDDATNNLPPSPIWLLALAAFLNAFAVAGMVEEIAKYFGYWMVEHPDLTLPSEDQNGTPPVIEAAAEEGGNGGGGGAESSSSGNVTTAEATATTTTPSQQPRSMKSLGAGITVAMVTTAVGFACCENMLYVFVYSRTSEAATQMVTLVARSIFPVHPLAAAIQSIGVVQRDVEKDTSMKFGRILLPALLLHGFFDFALMFLALLAQNSDDQNDGDDNAKFKRDPAGSPLDDQSDSTLDGALPSIICSVTIVLLAVVYYVVKALAQRKRLEETDRRREGNGEYARLLV